MWIVKYRPKNLKNFVNQKEAIEAFNNWFKNWKPGEKAALLFGPPGIGKTCFVEAFANENNLEIVQMNASDVRSKSKIEEVFGNAMKVKSLFKRSKIFLIDEADGLDDIGGINAVIGIIKSSKYPVVLTANDIYEQKMKALLEYCVQIKFKPLSARDIKKRLKEICANEKIIVEEEVINTITERNKGDLRACINDLEMVCREKTKVTKEDLEVLSYRDREAEIFESLKILFKTSSLTAARMSFLNVDIDMDTIMLWIYENIPNEYEKIDEIKKAFEALAKADLFRARIIHRNYWKLAKYTNDLMTIGVSMAKKEVYKKFTKYSYPSVLKYRSLTKLERKAEKEKLLELSKKLNCSTKKLKSEYLPYLNFLAKE